MKIKKISLSLLLAGLLCLTFYGGCKKDQGLVLTDTIGLDDTSIYPQVPPPDYWPTNGWQTTSPELQGIDSGRLADMIEYIRDQNLPIRSAIVVRNVYMLAEAYFHPFEKGLWHVIHSCTKSILSTLIGIAIQRGQIQNEFIEVLDMFPNYTAANNDERKEAMQLKHLLSMSTGMNARDSYLYRWKGLSGMRNSGNWTQYVLDLPMLHIPGTQFDYSNCSSYLICSLLQQAVGQSGLDYANQYLFPYLGIDITNVYWPQSPQGVNYGWGEMRIKPEDMAKIGFLYLHRGMWDGTQVVREQWVNKATRHQLRPGTLADGYGYQWWVDDDGFYLALGYGGQYIIVYPAQNLVVTFNSALRDIDFHLPKRLYLDYILPAITSDDAINENPQNQTRLADALESVSNPPVQPVPVLSAIALKVSGIIYDFDANQYDYNSIGLTFTEGSAEAVFSFSDRYRNLRLPLGLDNRYRTTFQYDYHRSYKGHWENENTFLIRYQVTDHTEWGYYRLTFSGNRVTVDIQNERYDDVTQFTGTAR